MIEWMKTQTSMWYNRITHIHSTETHSDEAEGQHTHTHSYCSIQTEHESLVIKWTVLLAMLHATDTTDTDTSQLQQSTGRISGNE